MERAPALKRDGHHVTVGRSNPLAPGFVPVYERDGYRVTEW